MIGEWYVIMALRRLGDAESTEGCRLVSSELARTTSGLASMSPPADTLGGNSRFWPWNFTIHRGNVRNSTATSSSLWQRQQITFLPISLVQERPLWASSNDGTHKSRVLTDGRRSAPSEVHGSRRARP